jgi:hypothetical protein
MFSKWVLGQMKVWVMEEVELVGYKRHWCFFVVARSNYPVQPHYPGVGWGLVWSLSVLVRGASYYIRVCRTPESGLSQVVGNSVAGPLIGYPSGRHSGFSCRGTGTTLDGGLWPIIRTPHTCVWRSVVVSRWIYRMVWVKCTTSVECKPIRIAESSVMDGCGDHYIAQCQVLVL